MLHSPRQVVPRLHLVSVLVRLMYVGVEATKVEHRD